MGLERALATDLGVFLRGQGIVPSTRRFWQRRPTEQEQVPGHAAAVVSDASSRSAAESTLHQTQTGLYPAESRITRTEEGFNESMAFKNSKGGTIGNIFFSSESISVQLVNDPKGSAFQLNHKIYKGDPKGVFDEFIAYLKERHGFEMSAADIQRIRDRAATLKKLK